MYSITLLICLLICSAIASDEHGSLRGLKKKEGGFLVEEQGDELEEPLQVEMELEFEGDEWDGEAVSFEDVNEIADLFKDVVNENGASQDESLESVQLNEVSAALAQNDDPSERMLRKKNRFKFHSRFTGMGTARRSRKNRALTAIERELHGGAPKKAADDMKRLLQNKLDEFVKANHTVKKGKVKDLDFKFDLEC